MTDVHYDRAPIVEAVINVTVATPQPFSSSQFDDLYATLRDDYPNRTELRQMSVAIGKQPGEPPKVAQSGDVTAGLRLTKSDSSRVVQIQRRDFIFSHLPPYTTWEPFRDEAKRVWAAFVRICQPTRIVRCATRYINRVEIPEHQIDFADYFNVYPKVPDVATILSASMLRVEVPQPDIAAHAVIQHALVDSVKPDTIAVMLDLDVMKQCELQPLDEALWTSLDSLRARKNHLFEACITNKTRSLIQ